jgi:hypothetical protein
MGQVCEGSLTLFLKAPEVVAQLLELNLAPARLSTRQHMAHGLHCLQQLVNLPAGLFYLAYSLVPVSGGIGVLSGL